MNEIARNPTPRKGKAAPVALSDALQTLRANRSALEAMGVVHAGVFGSVARGEAGPQSDIDVLVEVNRQMVRSIYDYCDVRLAISDLFGGHADVVERNSVRESHEPRIMSELINAF